MKKTLIGRVREIMDLARRKLAQSERADAFEALYEVGLGQE